MLTTVLMLVFPLMLAGILHMLLVKRNLAAFLAQPIHERAFGRNKTWRGFFFMPLFGIVGVLLARYFFQAVDGSELIFARPFLLGALLGLAYVLFELPNSFLKRRLGVPPGQLPDRNRALFFVLDHFDSTLGCILVYALLAPVDTRYLILALFIAPLIHALINLLLWALGIRKQKF